MGALIDFYRSVPEWLIQHPGITVTILTVLAVVGIGLERWIRN